MTITQRLSLAFSLLSASLIAAAVIAILALTGFQARFQFVQSNTLPSLIDLGKMVDGGNELIIWMYRHQSATAAARQAEVEKQLDSQVSGMKSLNQYYLANDISSDEDRQMTLVAATLIKEIEDKMPAFLQGSRAQDDKVSLGELQGNSGVGEATRQLIAVYKKQLQLNVDIADSLNKENSHIYKRTFWSMIAGASIIILILGMFATKTILNIRKNLNAMRLTMENASARLDLTLRADETRKDEIGLTAKAFNHLVGNVAASLVSVSASSQSVSTASAQISAGNEDLSSRTEQQAASLGQTAASMSELSETVRQTAENTRMASQLSDNARKISHDSSARVNSMLGTMSDIRSSSTKITDIISLIEGIAFQTNILALNAAVEAARAGEQGRGFAVVAGEVRNLAQRSSASSREIKELIESSMRYVETGASQAADVEKNMTEMNDAIRQVADLVNEISAAAEEQTKGIGQVHLAINQMDDVTQQNASLVEEASAASHSLMEQASVLNALVSTFVISAPTQAQVKTPLLAKPTLTPSPVARLPEKKVTADDENNWQSF